MRLVLAAVLLAGCASTPTGLPEAPSPGEVSLSSFVCPGGGDWSGARDLCADTPGAPDAAFAEPDLALRGSVIAVAVNGRAVGWTGDAVEPSPLPIPLPLPGGRVACNGFGVCLLVSEDGGRTWATSTPPSGSFPRATFDGQVEFGADGALHLVALTGGDDGGRQVLTHVATRDLGRTWGSVTLVDAGERVDRPWLAVRPDGTFGLVAMVDGGTRSAFGISPDGGNWTWLSSGLACRWPSRPVAVESGWLVGCLNAENTATRVLRVDARATSVEPVLDAARSGFFPVVASAGGSSAVLLGIGVTGGSVRIVFSRTDDGGTSWTPAVDSVRGTVLEAWRWAFVTGGAVHGDALHLLAVGGIGAECWNPCEDLSRRDVVHLVLDARNGGLVREDRLARAGEAMSAGRLPDDFHDVVFGTGEGAIAWAVAGHLHIARLLPEG